MKKIFLKHKKTIKTVLIDEEDWNLVKDIEWYLHNSLHTSYARGHITRTKYIYMHRLIMKAKEKEFVDHIDGNGLNNQKSNLRICTHSQNLQNRHKSNPGTSKYKGVSWSSNMRKWEATILANGKVRHLAKTTDEIWAARIYDAAARKYFGEFAKTNLNFTTDNLDDLLWAFRPWKSKTSRFRGISWDNTNQRWYARILFRERRIVMGGFLSEEEALLAYNNLCQDLYGNYDSTPGVNAPIASIDP